jgi:hypothetical protein
MIFIVPACLPVGRGDKPENPVLWKVQHNMAFGSDVFVIPNLFRDLGFGV